MPGPPPPPPPPAMFGNAGKSNAKSSGAAPPRGALLDEIANPKMRLKKTVTNDRSAPLGGKAPTSSSTPSNTRGTPSTAQQPPASSSNSGGAGGMGGLFGGGAPRLPSQMKKDREQQHQQKIVGNGPTSSVPIHRLPSANLPRQPTPRSSAPYRPPAPVMNGAPRLPAQHAKPTTSTPPPPPMQHQAPPSSQQQASISMSDAKRTFMNAGPAPPPPFANGSNYTARRGSPQHVPAPSRPAMPMPSGLPYSSATLGRPNRAPIDNKPSPGRLRNYGQSSGQFNTMVPNQAQAFKQGFMRRNSTEGYRDHSTWHLLQYLYQNVRAGNEAPPCPPHRRESGKVLIKPTAPPPPPPQIQKPSAPPPPPPNAARMTAPPSRPPTMAIVQPQPPSRPSHVYPTNGNAQPTSPQAIPCDWMSKYVFSSVSSMPRPPRHSGRPKAYSTAPRAK